MKLIPFFLAVLLPFLSLSQSQIIDPRDGQEYQITRLGDLFWMTENLRFKGEGSVCKKDCDQIRFYDYRYLSNVCPEGWRLPTMNEWDSFTKSFSDAETARMMEGNEKLYRVDFLDQHHIFESNVLNIKPYGRVEGGDLGEGNFIDFWSINPASADERFHMHLTPYSIVGHSHKHHLKPKKEEDFRLFPVRCVCESEKVESSN
ncbi:FISUMP domain-containing protein [Ekhidna sp.]|uniref:FISUMP domain-containing protein n=1 Tax=Ekhidna sp. TaxID=2608089 RepID=UPI003B5941B8